MGQPKSGIPEMGQPKSGIPEMGQPISGIPEMGQPIPGESTQYTFGRLINPNSFDKWLHVNLLFQSCCPNRSMSPVIEKMTWSKFQDLPRGIYSNLSLIHNFRWNMFMNVLHSEIFTPLKKTTLSEI